MILLLKLLGQSPSGIDNLGLFWISLINRPFGFSASKLFGFPMFYLSDSGYFRNGVIIRQNFESS